MRAAQGPHEGRYNRKLLNRKLIKRKHQTTFPPSVNTPNAALPFPSNSSEDSTP
jgi:hypothetical protein